MALASRGNTALKDENYVPFGKVTNAGVLGKPHGGLRTQQPSANERKTLSDISNTFNLRSMTNTPKLDSKPRPFKPGPDQLHIPSESPIATHKQDSVSKGFHPKAGPSVSSQKPAPRAPLRNITNKIRPTNQPDTKPGSQQHDSSIKSEPEIRLTKEMKRNAEIWAREGVERIQGATGQELEALRERLVEEEIQRRVTQVLSYRTDLPSMFFRSNTDELEEVDNGLKPDVWKYGTDEFGRLKFPGRDNMSPVDERIISEDELLVFENPLSSLDLFTSIPVQDEFDLSVV